MSWEHGTYGWERFESFLVGLNVASIKYTVKEIKKHPEYPLFYNEDMSERRQNLRKAAFTTGDKSLIIEEYLAVKDYDCDGADVIKIVVYEKGKRPNLKAMMREVNKGDAE